MRDAHERGTVLAGASAGAMGLAAWTWTPGGGIPGLGFVPDIAVFPHYDESRRPSWQANIARIAPADIGYLGLDERTGVISERGGWNVAGEGAAYWFAPGLSEPITVHAARPIAPALAPARTVPRSWASRIARPVADPRKSVGIKSGSPPGR